MKESRQRKQMNRARSDRALGSMDETTHKRLKTVDDTETDSNAEVLYHAEEKHRFIVIKLNNKIMSKIHVKHGHHFGCQ